MGGGAAWGVAIWFVGVCLACANALPLDKMAIAAVKQTMLKAPASGRTNAHMGDSKVCIGFNLSWQGPAWDSVTALS